MAGCIKSEEDILGSRFMAEGPATHKLKNNFGPIQESGSTGKLVSEVFVSNLLKRFELSIYDHS